MKKLIFIAAAVIALNLFTTAQVPIATGIEILKAEDARRYDSVLEGLLKSPNAAVRTRAALAAGRIGDKRAIPALSALFEDRKNPGHVLSAAAFAIGEIEAAEGGESILFVLQAESGYAKRDKDLLSRAVEAAGKIVAANAKDPKLAELKSAIVRVMNDEIASGAPIREVVLSGITAILRARPDDGETVTAKFLNSPDARIRADALNTLTRLRSKQNLDVIRGLLRRDPDAVVRANAARVLGGAEDKEALPLLLDYAVSGDDLRVRVACIRSLASLKDATAADKLIERGNYLLIPMHGDPGPIKPGQKTGDLKPIEVPIQKSELLEIATVLSRLLANTENAAAIEFLKKLRIADKYQSSETEIAFARIAPKTYLASKPPLEIVYSDFHAASAYGQGLAEIAALKNEAMNAQAGELLTRFIAGMATGVRPADQANMLKAMPDLTGSIAALKPDNLNNILIGQLKNSDVFIRAATAGAIAELPATKETVSALNAAFTSATVTDKYENDAQLAILDALVKLDKKAGVGSYSIALASPDYLVRKKAFEILADKELETAFPGMTATVETERRNHKDQVLPYKPIFGTKLGQVLNTDVDYRRALSRKNGSVKAVLTTEKGSFTIVFYPEAAPLTVDNWVKLARSGYFNGLEVHRVVPNFVMQDGDPRGDGNGGPGWSIRCEVNMLGYDRGAVGMALSGKDTGGSQWFVTHAPQPHLDGGYTVFGHVSEADMTVVDRIVRGDKILKVTIIGK
jgi:cyclophilin family peptidyl-prolyl cis-trans isomerase/HEAT repeat protein